MLDDINQYRKISDKLHTAAQPRLDQFNEIKDNDIELVINLARFDSPNAIGNEAQVVQEKGMDYINIPVDFENPTLADLTHFFKVMNEHQNRNIFVHCACNWRVSSFVFLYRVIQQHVEKDIAKQDLLAIWQPDKIWRRFIEDCLTQADALQQKL